MEKKTAVEWLISQQKHNKLFDIETIEQAKEMEKEQQAYSEEEVIELLTKRCKYFGTSVSPFNKLLLKQDLEWFEQFKKK